MRYDKFRWEDIQTISYEEYVEMQKELYFLYALRAAGVDNWDGIDYAIDIYEDYLEDAGFSDD